MKQYPIARRSAGFRTALLLLALLGAGVTTVAPAPAEAGPWTKNQGEFYVKLGESMYMAGAYRNSDGELIKGVDYMSASTFVYAEYGLLDGLHLQAYVPLLYARNTVPSGTAYTDLGVGDAMLGLQASPFKLPIPTAIRLEAKLPMYSRAENTIGAVPARGDAQIDTTLWLSAGAGTATVYGYLDIGYQHRTQLGWDELTTGPFSDGAVYLAQVGFWAFDQTFLVALNSSGLLPFEQDTISKSYITVGPSLFFPINSRLSLEADAYITPYSRNSANGWSVGLGLSYRG